MSKKSSKKPKSSSVPPAPKPKSMGQTPATPPTSSPASRVGSSSTKSLKERKEERDKQQRRNQQVTMAAVVGVVAVVFILLFLSANQPAEAPIDTAFNYANIPTDPDPVTGFPRLGNPEAPVTLIEYSSYGCPHCKDFHAEVFPQLLDRVRQGQLAFVFFPQFTGAGNVEGATRAALCVWQQDEDKFWGLQDIFFNWQNLYATNAFNQNRLTTGMTALGVNMTGFNNCLNSQHTNDLILKAQRDGVASTPTIKINNIVQTDMSASALLAAIDSQLAAANLSEPLPVYPVDATAEPETAATTEVNATEETVVTEEANVTEEAVETEEAAVTREATAVKTATKTPARTPSAEPTAEATSED